MLDALALARAGRSRIATATMMSTLDSYEHDPVLVVEKPYLRGFAAGFVQGPASGSAPLGADDGTDGGGNPMPALRSMHALEPAFVLLVVNGGDEPVTPAMLSCERISEQASEWVGGRVGGWVGG